MSKGKVFHARGIICVQNRHCQRDQIRHLRAHKDRDPPTQPTRWHFTVPVDSPKLVYHQGSGVIETPEGVTVAYGWAGNGSGKNNPEAQDKKCIGPLPQGLYVVGVWEDHPHLGKMVTPLTQIEGETFDRGSFFIHGPSKDQFHYGQESMGCIVVPFTSRLKVKEELPEGSYLKVEA